MYKILITGLIVCLISINLFAQYDDLDQYKKWQIKDFATDAYNQQDYYTAINLYSYLSDYYPQNNTYKWKLALSYFYFRNYPNSLKIFSHLQKNNSNKLELVNYYKAIVLKNLNRQKEALQTLKSIKYSRKKKWMPNYFDQMIDTHIQGCKLALNNSFMNDSIFMIRLNQSINSPHVESNPFYLNDTVFIYTSTQVDSLMYYNNYGKFPKRNFYISVLTKDNQWLGGNPVNSPFINSNNFDTGNGVFSFDKKRFYFTISDRNWNNRIITHIYVSEKKNNTWSEPILLEQNINIDNYSSTQPAIGTCYNPNLEVIYFISDRTEGYGGTDIWYFTFNVKTHKYSRPINAGIRINSFGNETTPFFDKEQHLMYFSSDGWPGYGGLDIFCSKGDMVNWENPPYNLGRPFNSSADDMYYTENDLGNKGFLTSNRPGGNSVAHNTCCDDIFSWRKDTPQKINIKGQLLSQDILFDQAINKDRTIDKTLKKPLTNSEINLYVKKDSVNSVFISRKHTDSEGKFSFLVPKGYDYEIFINDDRVLDKRKYFNAITSEKPVIDISLKPIVTKSIIKNTIILENIYYEFNQTTLNPKSKATLDSTLLKFLQIYPDIIVEIRSHTDNIGDTKYNQKLSLKRASNVAEYLIEKGINKNRLKYNGYGESDPLVPNTYPGGKDNPEGRARNRRTEFKIINNTTL